MTTLTPQKRIFGLPPLLVLILFVIPCVTLFSGCAGTENAQAVERARALGLELITAENLNRMTEILRIPSQPVQDAVLRSFSFNADGTRIVTSIDNLDDTGSVQLWDAITGELLNTIETDGELSDVALSPDGTRIVIVALVYDRGRSHYLRMWDAATGDLLDTAAVAGGEHITVAFSPDGTRIVSNSMRLYSDTQQLWDAATLEELAVMDYNTSVYHSPVFSPDGTLLAFAYSSSLLLYDATNGNQLAELQPADFAAIANNNTFSPDGRRVLVGYGPSLVVWDATSRRTGPHRENVLAEMERHDGFVNSVAFSPDGTRIFAVVSPGIMGRGFSGLKVWDAASGRVLADRPLDLPAGGGSFSPDGTRIAFNDGDHVFIWGVPLRD